MARWSSYRTLSPDGSFLAVKPSLLCSHLIGVKAEKHRSVSPMNGARAKASQRPGPAERCLLIATRQASLKRAKAERMRSARAKASLTQMWNRIERLTAPAEEALTLAQVKAHCRVDSSDEDSFLTSAIKAARELVEGPDGAGLVLISSQWRMSIDCMLPEIRIPMGPVISIDEIAYVDEGGSAQTVSAASYQWRKGRYEAYIKPGYDLTWPTVRRQYDAVQVTFTAGYPGTDESPISLAMVPEPLRKAMLMLIGHWYENRETVVLGQTPAEMPLGYTQLLNNFRVGRFA